MSISNLMTTKSQISDHKSNLTKTAYRQVTPDRTLTSDNFKNGEIIYRFSVSGNSWWIPSKSYMGLRSKMYITGTTQPSLASDIAPAPGFTGCLFSQAEMRLNDQPLSRINSFLPQVDAIKTRIFKSKAWRDSIGKSTNFWETNFERRRASIVSNLVVDEDEPVEQKIALTGATIAISTAGVLTGDATALLSTELAINDVIVVNGIKYQVITAPTDATGTTSVVAPHPSVAVPANANFYKVVSRKPTTGRQQANLIETVWQPPLSIFDITTPLPPGNYSLHLTPNQSNYKNACFESKLGALTTQDVIVENMYFNACIVDGVNPPDDFEYYLDLEEIAVVPKELSTTTGEQVLDFSVAPTTYALSVAVQEKKAGSDTRFPPTKFVLQNSEEKKLSQMRLTYAGQTQPSPDMQVSYGSGTDHLTKMYVNTVINANGYDYGVLESKKEYLDMGWFQHYTFLKPSGDASSRVDLAITVENPTEANALLFSHHSKVAHIVYKNRQVETVRVEYG
jgi:hypothetical protein